MNGTALSRREASSLANLMNMQNRLNELFRGLSGFSFEDEGLTTTAWAPRVDIYETSDAVEISCDMPGVKKEDVRITTEGNQLTIRGERRLEHEDSRDGYHRVERTYGAFERSFALPQNVDPGSTEATYRDGVLTLRLPKRPEAKPRQIEIGS
jgi:HSP20 family protein